MNLPFIKNSPEVSPQASLFAVSLPDISKLLQYGLTTLCCTGERRLTNIMVVIIQTMHYGPIHVKLPVMSMWPVAALRIIFWQRPMDRYGVGVCSSVER